MINDDKCITELTYNFQNNTFKIMIHNHPSYSHKYLTVHLDSTFEGNLEHDMVFQRTSSIKNFVEQYKNWQSFIQRD